LNGSQSFVFLMLQMRWRDFKFRWRLVMLTAVMFAAGSTADAQPSAIDSATNAISPVQPPVEDAPKLNWGLELKRQFTDRATPQESSRTTVRMEVTPQDFSLSLVRVDVPFVDKKNGDAFGPRLGDLSTKLVSRRISWRGLRLDGTFETTFPSAQPQSLGNGKYQLGPGFDLIFPLLNAGQDAARDWQMKFDLFTKQVFSVAGDSDFKDINYTRAEPGLMAVWRGKLLLGLTPKLVYDWEQDQSGAVIELESDWNINRHWRLDLVLGHGLWNTSVPTGYESKIEFSVRYNF
jgi:hypothetical protein